MSALDNTLAIILGGGRGSRLFPLTKMRSKPAVPMAGKYRLIDIPISNCINSGIYRIAVLTQFNSVSLHRHITNTYIFDAFHTGWVQVWAAEQTMDNADWYQGTADAVRKQLFQIRATRAEHVLIMAGDHLYRMDYAALLEHHAAANADITVAVQPVRKIEADRFGLLKRGNDLRITRFAEKPKDPQVLADFVSRDDPERPYLGSMGIYLFNTRTLFELLERTQFSDFGGQVIPYAIERLNVSGYDFEGYWEDIGTIRSFYETNLALTTPKPHFNLFDKDKPIYNRPRHLPGSTIENSKMENVLIAEGCCVQNAEIRHSIVGLRCQIFSNVRLVDTIIMGSDDYDDPCVEPADAVALGIGSHSDIQGAIIDKNARIGHHTVIRPFPDGTDLDGPDYGAEWFVREGIVIIPKNCILKPHTYIGPDMPELRQP